MPNWRKISRLRAANSAATPKLKGGTLDHGEGHGGNAHERPLARPRRRPRVEDVGAEIGSMIDAGNDEIDLHGHESEHRDHHAVRGRSPAGKALLPHGAHAQGIVDRDRVRAAALFGLGGDHPDLVRGGQVIDERLDAVAAQCSRRSSAGSSWTLHPVLHDPGARGRLADIQLGAKPEDPLVLDDMLAIQGNGVLLDQGHGAAAEARPGEP